MTRRSAYFRKLLPVSRRKEFHLYLKNKKLFRIILHVGSLKTCKKKKFSKLAGRRFTIGFSGLFLVFEQIYKLGKNSFISKFDFSRPPWFADTKRFMALVIRPKRFGRLFRDLIFLSVSKPMPFRYTKLCDYVVSSGLVNLLKDQLSKMGRSLLQNWIFWSKT